MMTKNPLQLIALILLAALLPVTALAQKSPMTAPQPASSSSISAPATVAETLIAPGDVLRISVFQSPDLTLETRVDENGTISYPLIGTVKIAGISLAAAEERIAKLLRDGGFIVAPHVTVAMVQVRGSLVTVLGLVTRPGRFPLDSTDNKLTDVLALAGGISAAGADVVVLTGMRDGKPIRREIDIQRLAMADDSSGDIRLKPGDMLYVNRAPNFFIYGEVQRPGAFRLERGMTVMQALATGGGLTAKGTQRGLSIHRRDADGTIKVIEPKLDDAILADDVIYVRESIF